MSLLEEWDAGSGYQDPGQAFTVVDDGLGLVPEPSFSSVDRSIFGLQVAERQTSRGKGLALAIAAAEGSVTVVTSRAYLIRYDLTQGTNPVLELELSRHADANVRGLWVSAEHTIIALQLGSTYENHYIHANWKKSRVLSKLKDVKVSCIGWNKDTQSESTTGDILVGSLAGVLNEVVMDEKDKKERVAKRVFQLQDSKDPMTSVHQHRTSEGQRVVLMATADRLYIFTGKGSLEAMFARYNSPDINNYIELGGGVSSSPLQLYYQPGATQPEAFAWLTQPGVYYGDLTPDTAHHTRELDLLKNHRLLPYSSSRSDAPTLPLSVALSQYYLLLLFPSKVQCINRINGQVKQELAIPPSRALQAGPQTLALASDAAEGTLYLMSGDNLQEITVHEESRDMWRVYLDQQDYKSAFRHCKTQAERDTVNSAEAEACFGDGNFVEAARLLGRVTAAVPAFEEVVLRFVEADSPKALQTFLQTKMDSLGHEDKAQATMVGTWLLELYLDQLNRSLLEVKGQLTVASSNGHSQGAGDTADGSSKALPAPDQLTQDLRAFLKRNVEVLDVNVTISLLAGYGRLDDLMEYATYRKDWEAVVDYLMQRGEADRALPVLRRPGVSQELWYKFAPTLMLLAPAATVDAWMTAQPPLDPPRLLPALLRFAEDGAPPECQAHALRFVEFCIHHLENDDPAIHHLAAALYCLEDQEGPLLQYLASARDLLGRPLYDPQTALRLARQRNKLHASVQLLCDLNLYEDAVVLALSFDMALASATANRPEEEPALKRSLWLTIARYIVQQHPSQDQEVAIKQVNEFLRESGGVIKIEDVLPLFPDFVKIDNFKEAICQSLEDYNKQIDQLKGEMEDATRIADALRKDMAALEHRAATLDLSEECARCGVAVGEPPHATAGISGGCVPQFYLFPSGNAFHGTCLASEVMQLVPPPQQQRIHNLLLRLSQVAEGSGQAGAHGNEPPAKVADLRHSLEQEIALEDPYCGEIVVRNISKLFVRPDEVLEVASWEL
ncbi:hypothetical protein ABBQ38_002206 [Trebouxia sp. C0009 RCD-2024]